MKKLGIAILSAGLLLSFTSPVKESEAYTFPVTKTMPNYIDFNNSKIVDSLKNSTYQYKGIKLGTTYKEVLEKLGKPVSRSVEKEYLPIHSELLYKDKAGNKVIIYTKGATKTTPLNKTKVSEIRFLLNKYIKFKSVKASLGTYEHSQRGYRNDLYRRYSDHFFVDMYKHNHEWYVTDIYYGDHVVMIPE